MTHLTRRSLFRRLGLIHQTLRLAGGSSPAFRDNFTALDKIATWLTQQGFGQMEVASIRTRQAHVALEIGTPLLTHVEDNIFDLANEPVPPQLGCTESIDRILSQGNYFYTQDNKVDVFRIEKQSDGR